MSDMLLALFTTLAVALAVLAYRPGAPAWTVPLLGAVAGLGFATKGPVALLVPGLAVLLLMWENRRRPLPCGWGPLALGVLAFAVLGLGWFALVYRQLGNGAARRLLLPREPGALRRRGVRRGPALLVLPARVPRGGAAVVAVPADRPVAPAALARRRRGAAHAVPGGLGGARPRAAEPLAREDRLLPPADLPRRVARDRPLPRRRAVEAGRPRVGQPRPDGRGGGARPRSRPAAADPRRVAARGPAAGAPGGRGRGGRGPSARRGRAPDAAPRRRRARLADRRGVARARRLLPAGLRRRPSPTARSWPTWRARGRTGPTCGWPSAPTRPA